VSTDVQQRAYEVVELIKNQNTLKAAFPVDASVNVDVDGDLSFLDDYVSEALAAGAAPYNPPSESSLSSAHDGGAAAASAAAAGSGLKFQAYTVPQRRPAAAVGGSSGTPALPAAAAASNNMLDIFATPAANSGPAAGLGDIKFNNVKRVWGPDGYNEDTPKQNNTAPVSNNNSVAAAANAGVAATAAARKNAAAAVSTAPVAPAVQTEREKMAAALFGGLGAAPVAAKPVAAPAMVNRAPSVAAAAAPVVAAPVQAKKAQDTDDILDLAFGGPTPASNKPAAAPVAAAPAAKSGMDDFDSLFGSPSASATPAAASSTPAAAASSVADPLDLFGAPAAPAAAAASALASAPAAVGQRLAGYGSKTGEVVLGADAHVRISLIRARHEQRTSLLLLLSRISAGQPIRSAALHLPVPAMLLAQSEVMPAAQPLAGAPAGMVALPPLDTASGAAAVWFNFVVGQQAAKWPVGPMVATLGYVDPTNQQRKTLAVNVDFHFADLVRPVQLTTPQFGQGWKQLAQEQKFSV
jgi:hypothetical protein